MSLVLRLLSFRSLLGGIATALTFTCTGAAGVSTVDPTPGTSPRVIRLGTYETQPLVVAQPGNGVGGFFGDYLVALEARRSIRFEIVYFSDADELSEALRSGQVDAAAPLFAREGKETYARYTASIGTFAIGIFASSRHPRDAVDFWELSGRRVVVVKGSTVEEFVRKELPNAQLQVVESEAAAFTALAANQADYAVTAVIRALDSINKHRLKDLALVGYAPFARELAFAVAIGQPAVFQALQEAIATVPAARAEFIQDKWMSALEKPWYQRSDVIPWLVLLNAMVAVALLTAWGTRRALSHRNIRLEQTQRLLDQTARSAVVGGWEYDRTTKQLNWTLQTHRIHGSSPESFKPSVARFLELCDEEVVPAIRAAFLECCTAGTAFEQQFRLRTTTGRRIWVSLSGEAENNGGRINRLLGSLRDIDHLKRQQLDLKRSERLYKALAEGTSDVVSVHDRSGMFLYVSPSVEALTGYLSTALVGTHPADAGLLTDRATFDSLLNATYEEASVQEETYQFKCKDGTPRWFEHRASLFEGSELDGHVIIVSRDITERLATAEHFRHLALHDSLTGLHNRLALSQRLDDLVAAGAPAASRVAVCFLDTDNFKAINDSFGHAAGDKAVREFARRVLAAAGKHMVSRIGGDEFVVLIATPDAAENAETLAQELMKAFAEPIALDEGHVTVTASVGVAAFPEDVDAVSALVTSASTAMYAAKADGKNTCRRYTREMGRASATRARALQDVRDAYERGELELFYQPKIHLATERISGVEALLRWRTAGGYRGPAELIAAAEESGFIKTLGRWVLEQAASQSLAWAEQGIHCPIAVNVSVKQLHDREFVGHLTSLIDNEPQLAGRLELEITETAIAMDASRVLQLLTEIRNLGVRVHIDDFGTGYSSLADLGRLPVDILKIDKSLVMATSVARDAREIVGAIIALATSLGLETVAEGVETRAQEGFLRQLGCTHAQGFLFARPMPPAELVRYCQSTLRRDEEVAS